MNVALPTPEKGQHSPVLVLNADFRPLSYYPLSLWSWQDAVKAVCLDKVTVVEEYDDRIASPSTTLTLPSVIALKHYAPQSRQVAFTRFNLFLRDRFTCQYCAERLPPKALTFDHVIPRSMGGKTSWENIVAACTSCNRRKANKLPREIGMIPITPAKAPTVWQLQEHGRSFPPNFLHHTWTDYLYWDGALECDEPTITA